MSPRGKGKVTRSPGFTTATELELAALRRGLSPLQIALSKARAARILLEVSDASGDYLQIPVVLKPGETVKDIHDWIESFAFDALDAALEEAQAAGQELLSRTTRKAVA